MHHDELALASNHRRAMIDSARFHRRYDKASFQAIINQSVINEHRDALTRAGIWTPGQIEASCEKLRLALMEAMG